MKKISLALLCLTLAFTGFAQKEALSIDSLVKKFTERSEFAGSFLVAYKGKIIISKGYGYQDVKKKIANTEKGIYNIASLTKPFTAALILKLQEAGKLSVKDLLSKYYPGYPQGDRITIHHLLTHTSGIFNYTDDNGFRSMDQTKAVTLEQMIAFFKDKPLAFEPGARFNYSNSGYTLLGYIIEQVTGKTYASALEQMIFKPLGMDQTTYGPPELDNPRKVTGYQMYFKNFQKESPEVHPSISYATGAIYSTVEDLYKWHKALQSGKFLTAASLATAYKKDVGYYGYGWSTDSTYGRLRVSHSGNIQGFKANINRMPADDVCVIGLSNSNNSSVGEMVQKTLAILYHQPMPKSFSDQPEIQLADSLLQKFEGVYKFRAEDSMKVNITVNQKHLTVKIDGQEPFDAFPVNKNMFKAGEGRLEFMMNKEGRIVQLYIFRNGEFIGVGKM